MEKRNLKQLENLFNSGFKCIKYEDEANGEFKAYFKNFETEKIDTIVSNDKDEINKMKQLIDENSLY
ncbi:hypothetical protein [Caloranaerobacter azorensis]|uniref:Uncharacterized protein n=2 Tax=Caloranaerobacter azorensis TaxID=116090 RepID=A0A1M5TGJ4_9FIRM|nr:hypothetical protein [Caloranaerobacter azorensis]QIB26653.1 hypothetical protein G3A45_04650 [Caloranaerobacter azorensis]SHH49788.1 hypothetical protein SAMN02745135_00991 [Caloranaerobacter azorensis DSM 13643]